MKSRYTLAILLRRVAPIVLPLAVGCSATDRIVSEGDVSTIEVDGTTSGADDTTAVPTTSAASADAGGDATDPTGSTGTGTDPTGGGETTGPGVSARAVKITVSWHSSCALTDAGTLHCWGSNNVGNLGLGHTMDVSGQPASANGPVAMGAPVEALAGGQGHTCALVAGGNVRCWGWGLEGQLGYGNTDDVGDDETPADAGDVPLGDTVIQLAAGTRHNCVVTAGGKVRCWGHDDMGVLGYGDGQSIGDDEPPSAVGDLKIPGVAVQVSSGMFHNCVLMDDGTVRCWGFNDGRLGVGHLDAIPLAANAESVALGAQAVTIASGSHHNCAITTTGSLRCWGMNYNGQLGYGHQEGIGDDEAPGSAGDVPLGGETVIDLALGLSFTCVLLESGEVRCAGRNDHGQLGLGHTLEMTSLTGPLDLGASIVELSGHGYHTCGIGVDGTVRCWGMGIEGALGHGNLDDIGDDEVPAAVGPVPFL